MNIHAAVFHAARADSAFDALSAEQLDELSRRVADSLKGQDWISVDGEQFNHLLPSPQQVAGSGDCICKLIDLDPPTLNYSPSCPIHSESAR
jgi:hypothetical protein